MDSSVITAYGDVKSFDGVVAEDLLLGDNSQPKRVIGTSVYRGAMYRVVPAIGDCYTTLSSHRLSLIAIPPTITTYSKYGKTCVRWVRDFTLQEQWFRGITGPPYDEAFAFYIELTDAPERVDVPIPDYVAWLPKMKELYMGYRAAVTWPARYVAEQLYDPYTVGMWYGKSLTTDTLDRPSFMERMGESDRELLGGNIPSSYTAGSVETRQQFLAGVIDILGYTASKNTIILTLKGDKALETLLFVARGLGIHATYRTVLDDRYQLFLEGDELAKLPVKLISKLIPSYRPSTAAQSTIVDRYLFTVYYVGEGDCKVIELEGGGRYLLGDYTVAYS